MTLAKSLEQASSAQEVEQQIFPGLGARVLAAILFSQFFDLQSSGALQVSPSGSSREQILDPPEGVQSSGGFPEMQSLLVLQVVGQSCLSLHLK